jgi:hypothetical protein
MLFTTPTEASRKVPRVDLNLEAMMIEAPPRNKVSSTNW